MVVEILNELNLPQCKDSLINAENVEDPVLRAKMKFVNHPSLKTIRDRFHNNRFFFNKVTKSDIRKDIINLNSAKASQDSDISAKLIKQNVGVSLMYYTLLSMVVWKMPSSNQY